MVASAAVAVNGCGGNGTSPGFFEVNNQTERDFTSVSIRDRSSGSTIYQSNLTCASGQEGCAIYYNGPNITGTAIFEFKDANQKIIAAYDTADVPREFTPLTVTKSTTGAYLYEELRKVSPEVKALSFGDLSFKTALFYSKYPDSSLDDDYEKLASHFIYQQYQNKDPQSFLRDFGKRLLNNETAESTEFQYDDLPVVVNTAARAGAAESESTCSPGVSFFLFMLSSATGSIGEFYPKSMKPFWKQIGKLGGDACKSGNGMSKIVDALNNIQNTVDNIQNALGALSNFEAKGKLESTLKAYDGTTKDLLSLSQNYTNLLRINNTTSLTAYVEKNYGAGQDALDKALADDAKSGVLSSIVEVAGSNRSAGFLKNIDALTSGDLTLIDGLNLLCKNPISGNLVEQRALCNMIISTTVARLVASQNMATTLAGEGYALLDAYPQTAKKYGYIAGSAQSMKELKTAFDTQSADLTQNYRRGIINSDGDTGYFKLFDGLNTTLLANLSRVLCFNPVEKEYLISAWVKEAANEYLITNCLANTVMRGAHTPVQAHYFLKVDGLDVPDVANVVNVMGVLTQAAYRNPYNNHGGVGAWGLDGQIFAFKEDFYPKAGTFTFNNSGRKTINEFIIDPDYRTPENFKRIFYPWKNDVLKADDLSLYTTKEVFESEGTHVMFRYTDKTGFSYIFMGISMYRGFNTREMSIVCMTKSCSGNKLGLDSHIAINFKNGPQGFGFDDADHKSSRSLKGWSINRTLIDIR